MAKGKTNAQSLKTNFSNHKFDSSEYLAFGSGIRRDSKTGRLMAFPKGKEAKPKK
jgi:hypothetical protein